MLEHARHFGDAAQVHLTPAPTGLRRAQRRDQIAGLLLQLFVTLIELVDLFGQPFVGALAGHLHPVQTKLIIAQRLLQRSEQALDRLLSLRQISRGRSARLAEPGVGELEELLGALGQGLRRQLCKRAFEHAAVLVGPGRCFGLALEQRSQLAFEYGPCRLGLVRRLDQAKAFGLVDGRGGLRLGHLALRVAQPAPHDSGVAGGARTPGHCPRNPDSEADEDSDEQADDHGSQGNDGVYQGRGWSSTWSERVPRRLRHGPADVCPAHSAVPIGPFIGVWQALHGPIRAVGTARSHPVA